MKFENNEHIMDRLIRLIIGIVLIALAVAYSSWLLGIVALIPIVTAGIGFCPLYSIFGIRTNRAKD